MAKRVQGSAVHLLVQLYIVPKQDPAKLPMNHAPEDRVEVASVHTGKAGVVGVKDFIAAANLSEEVHVEQA